VVGHPRDSLYTCRPRPFTGSTFIGGPKELLPGVRPEFMFSVSQLSRVMSCPTQENLSLARHVIKYVIGSLDLKITYRPDDPNDPLSEINNELMMFTDSDWATSVDTR